MKVKSTVYFLVCALFVITSIPFDSHSQSRSILQVSSSLDDAEEYSTSMYPTITYQDVNWSGTSDSDPFPYGIFRFLSDIPAGSAIIDATLSLYCQDTTNDNPDFWLHGERVDNATHALTLSRNVSNRSFTVARKYCSGTDVGAGYTHFTGIQDIVKEIVDYPGYEAGNYIALLTRDGTSGSRFRVSPYDASSSQAAILEVEWISPATATPTPRPDGNIETYLYIQESQDDSREYGGDVYLSSGDKSTETNVSNTVRNLSLYRFSAGIPYGATISSATLWAQHFPASGYDDPSFVVYPGLIPLATDTIGTEDYYVTMLKSWYAGDATAAITTDNIGFRQYGVSTGLDAVLQEIVSSDIYDVSGKISLFLNDEQSTRYNKDKSYDLSPHTAAFVQVLYDADIPTPTPTPTPMSGVTTVEVAVSSGDADAYYDGNLSALYPSGDTLYQGASGGRNLDSGFYFRPEIPAGATIISASIGLTEVITYYESNIYCNIRAENVDSATTFSNSANWQSRFPANYTTAKTEWHPIPAMLSDGAYWSPDLSNVIQEVVDRPGYDSVGVVIVFEDDDGLTTTSTTYSTWYSYERNPAKAAVLSVQYIAGSSEPTPTPTMTPTETPTPTNTPTATPTPNAYMIYRWGSNNYYVPAVPQSRWDSSFKYMAGPAWNGEVLYTPWSPTPPPYEAGMVIQYEGVNYYMVATPVAEN